MKELFKKEDSIAARQNSSPIRDKDRSRSPARDSSELNKASTSKFRYSSPMN